MGAISGSAAEHLKGKQLLHALCGLINNFSSKTNIKNLGIVYSVLHIHTSVKYT